MTDRSLADQFDARSCQRVDELHQRIHISADDTVTRFHALDRWKGETRTLRELALIDPQERPCGSHLSAGYHV
jgi:hypothetical protein